MKTYRSPALDATKVLTRKELRTVLAELQRKAPRSPNTWLNLIVFRLATCCGLRASEIARLRLSDVRVQGARPHLQIRVGAAKGGRSRNVPLWWDAGTLVDITEWKAQRLKTGADVEEPFVVSLRPGRAPTPQRRLQTMKLLRDSGVDVGLFLMPVLPGITDDFDNIRRVVAAAARAGASFVVCNCLFLRQPSRSFFFRYLENEHPDQLPAYRRAYGKSVYLSAAYRERLGARVRWAAEHNGIAYGRPAGTRRPPSGQLTLAL